MTFVDAVHYAPHGLTDVRVLDCDFLVCSPYKFFGPHMGTLYGKREHLERFQPYKVRPSHDQTPDRWETGTLAHELIAGIGAAVEYIAGVGRRMFSREDAAGSNRSRLLRHGRVRATADREANRGLKDDSECTHQRIHRPQAI